MPSKLAPIVVALLVGVVVGAIIGHFIVMPLQDTVRDMTNAHWLSFSDTTTVVVGNNTISIHIFCALDVINDFFASKYNVFCGNQSEIGTHLRLAWGAEAIGYIVKAYLRFYNSSDGSFLDGFSTPACPGFSDNSITILISSKMQGNKLEEEGTIVKMAVELYNSTTGNQIASYETDTIWTLTFSPLQASIVELAQLQLTHPVAICAICSAIVSVALVWRGGKHVRRVRVARCRGKRKGKKR